MQRRTGRNSEIRGHTLAGNLWSATDVHFSENLRFGLPFGAYGKLFAALRPAARDYLAAVGGFHTGAETMRFGAPPSIRLKRSFRHFALSF
jgi:hypothetical protein